MNNFEGYVATSSITLARQIYILMLTGLTLIVTACGGGGGGGGSATISPPSAISIVSVNPTGIPGNSDSYDCGESCTNMSTTGRYVVFYSVADNLVSGDTNGVDDVFIRDMDAGTTQRASLPNLSDQGTLTLEANATAQEPSVNSTGRFVVFHSNASNLVVGDTNSQRDVFLHDTQSGETVRVNVPNLADQGTLGTEANGLSERACVSDDGRYVGFRSAADNLVTGDGNGTIDVFVHDRQTGVTEVVSEHTDGTPGNGFSRNCQLSSDGMIIAFQSAASSLVTGDTNGGGDIFVHDRNNGTTTRVSVDSIGNEGTVGTFLFASNPNISGDGRFVTFWSGYSDLVAGDTNGHSDIFVHDRNTGETTRANVPNLVDQTTLGTQANNGAQYPSISDDGRFVAYSTDATNIVLDDTNAEWDIIVYDRQTGRAARANVDANGNQMTIGFVTDWAGISGDGRYVNFHGGGSGAADPDIVAGDSNLVADVYRAPNPLWE